ncbi:uncharacterized conserved protein YdeI, YjbR/CyaY-like superfamily, DUF1801 family [Bacteroidales bacterium 6E]|nr:uncharacterized conserved protein YdeI, YjbR/CyaY-like superfamily, DUF1801 family [Bacteroidales bacterium 6E]
MKGARNAEEFILENPGWQRELITLREIFLSTGLEETIKWGIPVYTNGTDNVAGMAAFKSYVGIWFYQGALLKDETGKLIVAQEGVTKAIRQWRFESYEEIENGRDTIIAFVKESVDNFAKGKIIKPSRGSELVLPEDLNARLDADPSLKMAFENLSLSRRRDYAEHIATAKREETRNARLEKIIPMILRGEGLNDKYNRK